MIIISSDKSFISEVSLATSLGWHSPPTIVLFERTYFLLRREMNCKKWLAVQDQDAVSLNIIVYIEWVVQVSSAHPVSSTDIHWQKLCRALTWPLHVFATFVRHNLCSCMFWFLYCTFWSLDLLYLFSPTSSCFILLPHWPFLQMPLFTPTPSFPHILRFLVAPQILTPTLEIPNFRWQVSKNIL